MFTFVCSYCVCIFFLFISGPIRCVTLEPFSFRIWIELHHRPLPGLFLSLVWLLCPKEWLSLVSFCSLLLAASYKFEYVLKIWLLSSLLTVDTVLLTSLCLYSSQITFSDSFKEYLALLLLQLCWSFPWTMLSFLSRLARETQCHRETIQIISLTLFRVHNLVVHTYYLFSELKHVSLHHLVSDTWNSYSLNTSTVKRNWMIFFSFPFF